MTKRKNLFILLGEWWDDREVLGTGDPKILSAAKRRSWLPSSGSGVFTLAVIGGLVVLQSGVILTAVRSGASSAGSTGTMAYQGRLADPDGTPLTGTYSMIFRLYAAASGGSPLWEETWTGPNGVAVSDGLFNVMLGSLGAIPTSVVTEHDNLWLGITVGTDDEMAPRVQLGSVPWAVQALTVPDGSVGTAKIADGAVGPAQAPLLLAGPDTGTRAEWGVGHHGDVITFSHPFSVAPVVVVTAHDPNPGWRIVASVQAVTTSSFVLNVEYADGADAGEVASWLAVGK